MSDNSAIEWTGATWNPVTGCTKVSPGCAHCYIERQTPMRVSGRKFVGGTLDVRLHPDRLDARKVAKLRPLDKPIFVCSMSDLFHEAVPWDHIFKVFLVMQETHQRTFQVLTKRPDRMRDLVLEFRSYNGSLDNVWLGVTIENARHTWRADVLREIPASVRFISAEPLLGSLFPGSHTGTNRRHAAPVGQSRISGSSGQGAHGPNVGRGSGEGSPALAEDPAIRIERRNRSSAPLDLTGIDWVIVGGESCPGARLMHPDWAREIRDACLTVDCPACYGDGWYHGHDAECHETGDCVCEGEPVECGCSRPAFFFKQWGGTTPKSGGRMLDGREWNEMPA